MVTTDTHYPLSADDDSDDLPRTLRRARAEQAAEQQRVEAKAQEPVRSFEAPMRDAPAPPSFGPGVTRDVTPGVVQATGPVDATVTELDIPFFRLMSFFVKAVFAAIPALILLTALLWLGGTMLEAFFPELIKAKILIHFPN